MLSITAGTQYTEYSSTRKWREVKPEIDEHVDFILGSMKIHHEKARYFVHRDVEGGKLLRHPWVERGLSQGGLKCIKRAEQRI